MNTYNIDDEEFKKMSSYQKFLADNPSIGYLKIRASAASGALPINNLKITVSKDIDGNKIIFYEGNTNSSGIIEKITLPAPKQNSDDLIAPKSTIYDINAIYDKDNNLNYKVNIYENIYVIQTINIVPTMNVVAGDN